MEFGLVLAGGGVRGAYHVGVWNALQEMNIKINSVVGTSIGAINGALFLSNAEKALKLWQEIDIDDIVKIPEEIEIGDNLFEPMSLIKLFQQACKNNGLDMTPLEEMLRSIIDEDKIRQSKIDFGITTFSVTERKEVQLFKEDIPEKMLVDYLLASACLIGFKKKKIGKKEFIDGGITDNMPIDMLIKKGKSDIICVDVKGIGIVKDIDISGLNIISIQSSNILTGTMDFDENGIKNYIQEGYYDTMKVFGKYSGEIYCFEIADYYNMKQIYSERLLYGMEYAAKIFDINNNKVYAVKQFISIVMEEYAKNKKKYASLLDEIKNFEHLDCITLLRLIDCLENKNRTFLNKQLDILGDFYHAANSILYFKRNFRKSIVII